MSTTKVVHLVLEIGSTGPVCGGEARLITSNRASATCPDCLREPVDDVVDDAETDAETDAEPLPVDVPFPIRTPADLKQWRKRHKLSLRKLAPLIDTHWVTIHRWELGASPIPRMVELSLNYLEGTLPSAAC
jgi:DNA-binding transcriptional regulator YiaG